MKTALLLTGNARFSEDFDSQLYNLQKSNIDVYVCFWKREDGFDPKISKNWLVKNSLEILNKLKPQLPWWYSIKFSEVIHVEDFDSIPNQYEPFNSTPLNVWQQYKCLQYCYAWCEHLDKYDLIIRSRGDLGLTEAIDLPLAYETLLKYPNLIFIPNNQRYGYSVDVGNGYMSGFNDQFAIGLTSSMKIYCNSVDKFDELYSSGIKYNPEYLVQTNLYNHEITWPPTSFEIVRDTIHWGPIKHGKWAEL